MSSYFKAFSVFLLWTMIALISHFFLSHKVFDNCSDLKVNSAKISVSKELQADSSFFLLNAENDTIFKSAKGFTIYKNSSKITENPSLNDFISDYLANNYDKELHITGKYLQNEIGKNLNSNLGLQRAELAKNELVLKGVPSYQIKYFGNISNFSFTEDGLYRNGIDLSINHIDQQLLDSIENIISTKILYVDFKNDTLLPTKNLENYTRILKKYLQNHQEKKVSVIGHTDNKGYYENNVILGLKRAQKIKEYFINNGIESTKLIVLSKGESKPIANKNTEEGKAINRRIEIQIN